jgi:zinc transport system ATP-binding protein
MNMDTGTILEVKNLSVAFEREEILRDISFSVGRKEALAIIGPNGAGKTVLFRALLGLIPYTGTIQWAQNIRIGYVPQKFFVERGTPLTAKEFFLLQAERFWMPQKEFLTHLEHELRLVGLEPEILHKPLGDLSGGQIQRLLISWAMLPHPDVLLFDEPTAGIDAGFEETAYQLIHRVQNERGTAVLLISHDLNFVYRYAEKVLCINKNMVCHGLPQEVLKPEELARIFGSEKLYVHKEARE